MLYNSAMRGQFSRFSSSLGDFPDPFLDVATMSMPQSMRSALQWAEYIVMSMGTYRMAMRRIISYFVTEVEFGDGDANDDEREKWKEFLDEMGIYEVLFNALENRQCYANDFSSVLVPFKRFLVAPCCGSSWLLREVYNTPVFQFAWSDFQFTATCPKCHKRGPWKVDDKPDDLEKKLKVKKWSPHEIEILHDYYTDEVAYLWRIPEDYKTQVRRGDLYHLERAAQPVLRAIQKNQMFRFHPDVIYHMKEPTLAGIRNRGWGIPQALSNFRQIYYVQVLRRYNEAIALDYVVPFRLLTPMPRPSGAGGDAAGAVDPLMNMNMGGFSSKVQQMLRRRRRDPAGWNVLPFPIQYQALGGDAQKLAPRDLLDQGTEQLLNDVGTPVEMYKGTLQVQAAPVALRLFEATWHPLTHDANGFLGWLVRRVAQILNWEAVTPRLKRPTMADDINKQMALLQLMMGQQISGSTGLKAMGLDWKSEKKTLKEEAQFEAKEQQALQEEMDQQGLGQQVAQGQLPGGQPGAPAGGGQGQPQGGQPQGQPGMLMPGQGPVDQWLAGHSENTPVSPQEMVQAADTIAQGLLGLPEAVKDSQLRALKNRNAVMHSIVKSRLEQIRRDAKNSGGAQMMQQQFGGGG